MARAFPGNANQSTPGQRPKHTQDFRNSYSRNRIFFLAAHFFSSKTGRHAYLILCQLAYSQEKSPCQLHGPFSRKKREKSQCWRTDSQAQNSLTAGLWLLPAKVPACQTGRNSIKMLYASPTQRARCRAINSPLELICSFSYTVRIWARTVLRLMPRRSATSL